jgi:hypothetical protein
MEAGHEELRAPINAGQKFTRATIRVLHGKIQVAISAIRYAQTKFEGTISKRVEDLEAGPTRPDIQQLRTVADERTQSFREEVGMRTKGVRIDKQATKTLVEAPRREFRSGLPEVENQAGGGSDGNRVTGVDRIKPRRFEGKYSKVTRAAVTTLKKALIGSFEISYLAGKNKEAS